MQRLTADEIPELLTRLVDKSLVHVDATGRFNLLQLVRSYGQEEIADTEDNAPTRNRHLNYYVDFSERQAVALIGAHLYEANEAFLRESENIRHAIEWAINQPETWAVSVQILNCIFWSYFNRGVMSEGLALCELIIAAAPENHDQRDLATAWGWLCTYQQLSDHPDAIASCKKAVELGEMSNDLAAVAMGTFQMALYDLRTKKLGQLQALFRDSLAAVQQMPGPLGRQMEFSILVTIANSAVMDGRLEEAKQYYEACRVACDAIDSLRGSAVLNGNLGHLYERLGDYKATYGFMQQALGPFLKLNDFRNLAGTLADSASGFWVAEDYETAAQTLGCAYGIWEASELVPDPIDYFGAERWRKRLMEKMGESDFTAAFEKGKMIAPKDMVAKILANPEPWN